MKTHILLAVDGLQEKHLTRIESAVDGWGTWERIAEATPETEYQRKLKNADVVLGWPKAEWLLASPVAFHQLPSAGYELYLGKGLEQKTGYVLANARGVMSVQVAEHCVAMMLALTRQLPKHILNQQRKCWQRGERYAEITDSQACIVGLGSIGSEIARRCRGLGMRTIMVNRLGKDGDFARRIYSRRELPEAMELADHVIVALPLTSQTRGLFNTVLFRRIKHGAFFFNLSRGGIVVEEDLCEALRSGHLGGAGLDVFENEPLPAESPLWEIENVIVTPHCAGRSDREWDRLCELFVENLRRMQQGDELVNRVLLERET